MMGGGGFNSYYLMVLREERRNGQKNRDNVNDAKLKLLEVTGTVLAATPFCDFNGHIIMLPPPTSGSNATAVAYPLMYVMHLAAAKDARSLNVRTKCVTRSYT